MIWSPAPGEPLHALATAGQAITLFSPLLPASSIPGVGKQSGAAADPGAAALSLAALYDKIFSWLGVLMETREQQYSGDARLHLLNAVSLSPDLDLVGRLWQVLRQHMDLHHFVASGSTVARESKSATHCPPDELTHSHALSFFFTCYANLLFALDDEEVYDNGKPLCTEDQLLLVELLGVLLR